jgi:hypothetical protein
MRSGLEEEPVGWIGATDPGEDPADPLLLRRGVDLTDYGIRKDVQALVAGIRTDLDSFCDAEAFALMTSGYKMAAQELQGAMPDIETEPDVREPWPFLVVEDAMAGNADTEGLKRVLKVGKSRAFKVWMLSRSLKVGGGILAVVFGALALWGLWALWGVSLPVFWVLAIPLGLALFSFLTPLVLSENMERVLRFRDALTKALIGILLGLVGWLGAGIHLLVFDRLYLRRGSIDRVLKSTPRAPTH